MIPETVFGLPLHPLAIHVPVVLVPLTAVGLILIVARPRWRARYGTLVAIGSVIAFLGTMVAYYSGRNFKSRLEDDGLSGELLDKVERHASLGATMPWFALALAIVTIAFVLLVRRGAASNVIMIVAVIAVVVGIATTVQLARTGDAGARSVFGG